jgi:hypothetical protein
MKESQKLAKDLGNTVSKPLNNKKKKTFSIKQIKLFTRGSVSDPSPSLNPNLKSYPLPSNLQYVVFLQYT